MLSHIAPGKEDDLLIGFETSDDAAVYDLGDGRSLVFTVDFFTPIVDDPYDFGRIAAANSLSDVYAMGGKPLMALNLLAFPCKLGADVIGAVMQGAHKTVCDAHAFTAGGHTIEDAEPKFGLAVVGMVDTMSILSNVGACVGDVLYLTKPIGTGIMTTALKRGHLTDEELVPVVESMATLNIAGSEAACTAQAHAGTDVTGFGLLGHLHEMCEGSGVDAHIDFEQIPLFEGVLNFATQSVRPGKTTDMIAWANKFVSFTHAHPEDTLQTEEIVKTVLCDPQTSGGMLVAVSPERASEFESAYHQKAGSAPAKIGGIVAARERGGHITVQTTCEPLSHNVVE